MKPQPTPARLGTLTANDFPSGSTVEIEFEDGSKVTFNYAFYSREEHDGREWISVYTEHNGYHLFFANSVEKLKGTEVK